MNHPRPAALTLSILGCLAACTSVGTSGADPTRAGGVSGVSYGTILGARPVTREATGRGWRSSLLAGLGGRAGATADTTPATEFLIREDGGRDIATVQGNADGLAIGERVAIIRGDRTRLARATGVPAPTASPRG